MLKKRKMLTVILIFLLSISTTSAYADTTVQIIGNGNTVTFNDLKGYGWASDAINSFVSQGIVKGDGSGQFKPAEKVTREQFAKMLTLTFNAPLSAPSVATFADVPTSRWSNTYIETSKDFLTGYSNPFGGLPSFHPAEYATREDIAVALVRILGLTDESAQDSNNVSYRFSDASEISNGLIGYVSIAAERNLISGYNDGTFRPQQGITRAEAVVLLNRATKQAVTTLNGDLKVSAEVIKGTEPKNVTLQIKAEEGTKITVDGTAVTMKNNGFGGYEGTYPYTFSSESSKTFTVIGTKAGKTKTVTTTATYQIDAPILTISYCPSEINNKNISLTGSITDKKYSTTLTINGELVDKSSQGMTSNWYWPCTLKEGQNTLNFVLTSSSGKTTTQTKTITYKVGGPELTITNCPSEISDKNVVLRGTMYDKDYSTVLKINGTDVSTSSAGNNSNWIWTYTLKEGENTLNFILTSASGKTTIQTKTILYKVGGPELTFTYCPSQVSDKKVDIKGTIYDKDYSAVLTVNGKEVSSTTADYKNNWNCAYTLDEGENILNFVVTSASGKTTSQTKTITYSVKDPKLNISYCPATVSTDSVTIRGSIYDEFYSTVLTINGSEVTTSSSGDNENWEKTYTLKEGENNFNFILTSGSGKTVTETKTIIYKPESSDPIAQ